MESRVQVQPDFYSCFWQSKKSFKKWPTFEDHPIMFRNEGKINLPPAGRKFRWTAYLVHCFYQNRVDLNNDAKAVCSDPCSA
eukprot:4074782-Ditylum_brightwellii.AAC.1